MVEENQDNTIQDDINKDNESDDSLIEEIEDHKSRIVIRIIAAITVISLVFLIAAPIFTNLNLPALDFLKESLRLTQQKEVKQFQESIATITIENRKGTGFNIDEQGLVVTNAHVVENAKNVQVSFYKGKTSKGDIWKIYPDIDIALIKIEGEAFPTLKLAQNTRANSGDEVLIIGNPLAYQGVANKGVVYGRAKLKEIQEPILLIDGPVNQGNSGSPVLNRKGEVIGVIFATVNIDNENGKSKKLGAAIPIECLLKYLPDYSTI